MKLMQSLLDTIFSRARVLRRELSLQREAGEGTVEALALARDLLAERSQSSGVQQALRLLAIYRSFNREDKHIFLAELANGFCPDVETIRHALADYDAAPSPQALNMIGKAAEAPRQELLRRINQAPLGTAALVGMRADLLALLPSNADLRTLDDDLVHLLRSWFNRGFLVMRRIDWSSPADLLERIIRYEAVHSIATWDELRDRLLPRDRHCYGFFHPAMGDEPLIFVEVALANAVPASIQSLLAPDRVALRLDDAQVATFYSISNCQPGLAGISFGQFLIKQVVDDLAAELPHLKTFVTLSPIPDFMAWLRHVAAAGDGAAQASLADGEPDARWTPDDPRSQARLALAARYFLVDRDAKGRLIDPVARFHVGNGARIERLCWMGDTSPQGMAQSGGLMVNYLYDLPTLEANRDGYARHHSVAAGAAVAALSGTASARG